MNTRAEDFVENLFVASTHATILVITKTGRAYALKVHEVPESSPAGRGTPIVNLVRLQPGEQVASIVPVVSFTELANHHLVMVTERGTIKKTELSAYASINVAGLIAMGVEEGDQIIAARLTNGQQEVLIGTRLGMACRFGEKDVRAMGRIAHGVRGIRLRKDDRVVSMEVVDPGAVILTVTEHGYGKRSELDQYRLTARGGVGVKTCRVTDKNGPVIGIMQVKADDDVMLITDGGMVIRTQVKGIPILGRDTIGVRLIDVKEGERMVSFARLVERESDDEASGTGTDENGEAATAAAIPEQGEGMPLVPDGEEDTGDAEAQEQDSESSDGDDDGGGAAA